MLCNYQKLAKTSASPGKTQMINHFDIVSGTEKKGAVNWYIVDLPGYGFAKVSQQQRRSWESMTRDYLQKRENLVNVFVLIDARHSPQPSDLQFINQLGEWQVPFALVFTKADKTTQQTVSKNVKAFLHTLNKSWEFLPPHFVTSAVKKLGRDKILAAIDEWNTAFDTPSAAADTPL